MNVLLGLGLINPRICFIKALINSEFRILLSNLFHSISMDGKERLGRLHVYNKTNGCFGFWILMILRNYIKEVRGMACFNFEKQAKVLVPWLYF